MKEKKKGLNSHTGTMSQTSEGLAEGREPNYPDTFTEYSMPLPHVGDCNVKTPALPNPNLRDCETGCKTSTANVRNGPRLSRNPQKVMIVTSCLNYFFYCCDKTT